jgi:hypothetical protein
MNQVKKVLGLVWIVFGLTAYVLLLKTCLEQIELKPTTDTIIQWSIFAIIFLPIAIGFLIFGWLAFQGAYDNLPESSEAVEE